MSQLWNGLWSLAILAMGVVLVLDWLKSCGVAYLPGWIGRTTLYAGGGSRADRWECAQVFVLAFAFRLVIFAAVALVLMGKGITGLTANLNAWMRWDALHYVNLVELGYAGYIEDGQHLFLVFFPLYVWLVRPIALALGNTMLAGLLVSWLCYAGGCVYLYKLVVLDYGRHIARWTVIFLSVFPYAFFFGSTMTEGLFLLTTAASLYHIRRHQWLIAGLWGMLAAMTRMQGVLMVGVALAELVEWEHPFDRRGTDLRQALLRMVKRLPALLLPVLGTLAYLTLNYMVDGDPFSFVTQQKHWYQGFLWISNTLWYVFQNALHYASEQIRLELWIPTALLFPVFLALLLAARRRHRGMYVLYAFVYLVLNYSLSWLLSAGRYLSCGIPFFLFAAELTRNRPWLARALAAAMGVLFAVLLSVYLRNGQVM